jgi:hypothetical protein
LSRALRRTFRKKKIEAEDLVRGCLEKYDFPHICVHMHVSVYIYLREKTCICNVAMEALEHVQRHGSEKLMAYLFIALNAKREL